MPGKIVQSAMGRAGIRGASTCKGTGGGTRPGRAPSMTVGTAAPNLPSVDWTTPVVSGVIALVTAYSVTLRQAAAKLHTEERRALAVTVSPAARARGFADRKPVESVSAATVPYHLARNCGPRRCSPYRRAHGRVGLVEAAPCRSRGTPHFWPIRDVGRDVWAVERPVDWARDGPLYGDLRACVGRWSARRLAASEASPGRSLAQVSGQ